MEWKETTSGHVNPANVIEIFVEERGAGNGTVKATIVGQPVHYRLSLFAGTLAECETYRDDFIGKKKTTRKRTTKKAEPKAEPETPTAEGEQGNPNTDGA